MGTTKEAPTDPGKRTERVVIEWKSVMGKVVGRVSQQTGLEESTVRAGLLFAAGVVAGLIIRSRR